MQARVSPASGTPRNATFLTMGTAGCLALLLDIELLAELVSIGTLVRGARKSGFDYRVFNVFSKL